MARIVPFYYRQEWASSNPDRDVCKVAGEKIYTCLPQLGAARNVLSVFSCTPEHVKMAKSTPADPA